MIIARRYRYPSANPRFPHNLICGCVTEWHFRRYYIAHDFLLTLTVLNLWRFFCQWYYLWLFLYNQFLRIWHGLLHRGWKVDVASFGAAKSAGWRHSFLKVVEGVLYHLVQVMVFEGWVNRVIHWVDCLRDWHYALYWLSEYRPMLMLIPSGYSNWWYGLAKVYPVLILILLETKVQLALHLSLLWL